MDFESICLAVADGLDARRLGGVPPKEPQIWVMI